MLKKSASILFFMVYLLSTTEAHQLFKLPVVFQHYAEHKREDKDITIFRFLAIHYLHGSPRDKDYDRDMQLPFKATADCATAVVPVTAPEPTLEISAPEFPGNRNEYFNRNDYFIPSEFRCSIFQPPRI